MRAGATLLYDSNPPAEELETELKASAMIDAIVQQGEDVGPGVELQKEPEIVGLGKRLILIDHEDSFVHTLGNYLRQTGASVTTLRSGPSALKALESMVLKGEKPDLVSFFMLYSFYCFVLTSTLHTFSTMQRSSFLLAPETLPILASPILSKCSLNTRFLRSEFVLVFKEW